MAQSNVFSLELARQLYQSVEQFPVDFENAWTWLEFSTKGNAKRSFEKAGFIERIDFEVFINNDKNSNGGRPSEEIRLTCECFKQWGMMAGTEKGKQIRLYFLECERVAKAKEPQPRLSPIQQTITDVDTLIGWIAQTDTEKNLLEQAKYDTVASIHPEYRPILEAAKKVRSTEAIHESVGMTATEVGCLVDPKLSAREVNDKLESIGFQFRQPKKKRGKDSYVWQLTEEGKQYGFVYFATNESKWSGDQIRWQDSVIEVIQDYSEEAA